jgi:hypothetical protein
MLVEPQAGAVLGEDASPDSRPVGETGVSSRRAPAGRTRSGAFVEPSAPLAGALGRVVAVHFGDAVNGVQAGKLVVLEHHAAGVSSATAASMSATSQAELGVPVERAVQVLPEAVADTLPKRASE